MLVLTRKAQETIKIGEHITVTVIKTKGKAVRLGIEAPSDVSVLRGELAAAIDADEPDVSDHPRPNSHSEPQDDAEQGEVRYARVSRSKVGSVLPDLLGEAGPLREMLLQRSSAQS